MNIQIQFQGRRCKRAHSVQSWETALKRRAADSNGILGKQPTDGAEVIREKSKGRYRIILLNIEKALSHLKTLLLGRNQKQINPNGAISYGINLEKEICCS